ncbi:A/G-specific adenine glycosylase [Jeotgalibacillus aurantiacus]|uniref:A/G-specific adenine glycosylase n=1 Tax=Jeotgalibacillus aurantiacus TaxID=2763266 RepID=UPI001D09E1C4|nr:A/G-specific adenine glycosylase [Jeotgalibacillus aurantiacus]
MNEELKNQLQNTDVPRFQADLIGWFEKEMRDLPWRENQDPYKVWVSEIMLQQTRVDTVIPYFNRFMEQFPTVQALAEAPEEKVLKAWEGLGYYSRARNLQAAVREVHENYAGVVPDTPEAISSLKGVGPYTAGAVLSIAYNRPEPAVDGNVMRVLSRILSIWDDIAKPSTRKTFEQAVRHLISKDNPSYFNQAMMELGAIVCTPTSPSCLLCPVQDHCEAFRQGTQRELPVKTKKKSSKVIELLTAIVQNEKGEVLVTQRPEQGLLANLWEFPSFEKLPESETAQQTVQFLDSDFYVKAEVKDTEWMKQDHVFTHLVWKMNVVTAESINPQISLPEKTEWASLDRIHELAMPVSHRKIANEWIKRHKERDK